MFVDSFLKEYKSFHRPYEVETLLWILRTYSFFSRKLNLVFILPTVFDSLGSQEYSLNIRYSSISVYIEIQGIQR